MSWRTVVVSKPSKLDLKMGFMSIRDSENTVRVHLSEITILIIETTACSITTALMCELIKKKIKVIFCDEKQSPISELTAYNGSHDCSAKIRNQINWVLTIKQMVWTEIVAEKIKKQSEVLDFFELPESEMLRGYIDEIEFYDSSNREGHAAKVYFNSLFGKKFSRSDDCSINAALNYGYSIILSCFNREIVCSGYLTQLGIFHDNMFNPYNLSCDLMEPFRPIVDKKVKLMNPTDFTKEEKHMLLSLLNDEFVFDGKKQTLVNTIKLYTRSVLNAIESQDTSLIRFYKYEL